jgi:hypothetical protein
MNTKRFFLAFIVAFFFIFGFEWLFHGVILKDTYAALPQGLTRPSADFGSHFHWLVLGQAVMTFFFTMIYARGFGGGGVGAGVCLGILLALMFVGSNLIVYCVQPFPSSLIVIWSVGGLVEYAIAGAIIGAIYKPGVTSSP